MNVTSKIISSTNYEVNFSVDEATLKLAKKHAVKKLSKNIKIAGFRPGKAPAHMTEKAIDEATLQNEFINEALNHSLSEALEQESLRPVVQPEVELTKFVPYSNVEFKATVYVLGPITLPDYKNLGVVKTEVVISEEDINQVIKNLQRHMAEKTDVARKAKIGDQLLINFDGVDDKGIPVNGASGKDYPIIIGSNTFIPGFEENLIGLKAEDDKTFMVTFPKDYGVKALQNRKVTFTCRIGKVQEIVEPLLNDDLAKKANPMISTVKELKEDIKKQLNIERTRQSEQEYDNAITAAVVEKTDVDIPDVIIEEQISGVMRDLNQNLIYRGQTYKEFLDNQDETEENYRKKELLPEAKRRIVAGIALSEIADKENVTITPEELEMRLQILKGQHASDKTMMQELETNEGRRTVACRLLTEKTIDKLKSYA